MEFDPHAQFDFEIQIDDEIPKYVTLDELKELIMEDPYKTQADERLLNFQKNKRNGLTYVDIQTPIFPLWVCSHILVNTCMQDPDSYDWFYLTDMYNFQRIAEFVYIWVNPYTWIPKNGTAVNDYLIMGKVAYMKHDEGRVDTFLHDWLTKLLRERVLLLADGRPTAVIDREHSSQGKILKGMLAWDLITADGRKYIRQFMDDREEKADIEYFHTEAFRENIQFIAQERGGNVAAELVQRLRKDWNAIVSWKCFGIDKISPEQVEAFRQCLFEGMEYYLDEWTKPVAKELPEKEVKPKITLEDIFSLRFRRTDDYNRMLQFLESERLEASDPDWARYALALYEANIFVRRPARFTQWLPKFCELFGRHVAYREPSSLKRTPCQKDITVYLPNW